MGTIGKLELSVVALKITRNHARAEMAAGFSTAGAAWTLKPLRTDSVSRGRSISFFTRETISLSISIRLFFFMKRPSLNDEQMSYRIEFGSRSPSRHPQIDQTTRVRVYSAAALAPPTRISPAPASEQKKHQ